jgi:hypothetical protein
MSYNLTGDEEGLLRQIVGAIRARNLKEEFVLVWGPNGPVVGFKQDEGWLPFPAITKSGLSALEREAMIRIRAAFAADGDNVVYVSVTQKGYDGVDCGFREKKKTNWPMVSALIALAAFCGYVLWKLVDFASQ